MATQVARDARKAARQMLSLDGKQRDAALAEIRACLGRERESICTANREDKAQASSDALDPALQKRLSLEGGKFDTLLAGIDDVRKMTDPVGKVSLARELDEGLELYRVACPIGVICVIFESRPDAAVQIASLAVKSANAVILKGGKEALRSNTALIECIRAALANAGLPPNAVQLVSSREDVHELLKLDEFIDLVIPRGSKRLVRFVMDNTRIPVMGHADGLCSVYLDRAADAQKAASIVADAKAQYPAVCNAAETLLVHDSVVETLLPTVGAALQAKGVVLHADQRCFPHLPPACCNAATDESFDTEFLRLEMAVRSVPSLEAAIEHINSHGSHHTDAIITEDGNAAEVFMQRVDSAGVFHNASTRFADGFRYGFGAEVGVSTNRIHARGPVGLEGLMIYKYRLHGKGTKAHCVAPYSNGERSYTHTLLPDVEVAPSLGSS